MFSSKRAWVTFPSCGALIAVVQFCAAIVPGLPATYADTGPQNDIAFFFILGVVLACLAGLVLGAVWALAVLGLRSLLRRNSGAAIRTATSVCSALLGGSASAILAPLLYMFPLVDSWLFDGLTVGTVVFAITWLTSSRSRVTGVNAPTAPRTEESRYADGLSAGSHVPAAYELVSGPPALADYLRLRAKSGLSPKTSEQGAAALRGSWTFRHVRSEGGETVAMGRVVGDGGWYFLIADMATLPEHQGRGLGRMILAELLKHIRNHAPAGAYVTLTADPPGRRLYESFGFEDVAPGRTGMHLVLPSGD